MSERLKEIGEWMTPNGPVMLGTDELEKLVSENEHHRTEAKRQWEVNERLRTAIAPLLLWGRKLDDPEAIKNAEIMPRSFWHPELLAAIDALMKVA